MLKDHPDEQLGFIVGITHPDHIRSQHVLERSGFHFTEKSTYRGRDLFRFEIERDFLDSDKNPYQITEELLDKALKKRIYEGFSEDSITSVGSDGNMEGITFVARDSGGL